MEKLLKREKEVSTLTVQVEGLKSQIGGKCHFSEHVQKQSLVSSRFLSSHVFFFKVFHHKTFLLNIWVSPTQYLQIKNVNCSVFAGFSHTVKMSLLLAKAFPAHQPIRCVMCSDTAGFTSFSASHAEFTLRWIVFIIIVFTVTFFDHRCKICQQAVFEKKKTVQVPSHQKDPKHTSCSSDNRIDTLWII